MRNNCNYAEVYKNGKTRWFTAKPCFRDCTFKDLRELRYIAFIEGGLNKEQCDFWNVFLKRIFADDLPFRYIPHINGQYITWLLNGFHHMRAHNLLYTTAFRYPDEFPKIVKILHKESKKHSIPYLFTLFHQLHIDMICPRADVPYPEVKMYADNLNHALIGTDGSSSTPISLERFRENLKKDIDGVHLHFA